MYSDRKKRSSVWITLIVLAVAMIAGMALYTSKVQSQEMRDESATAIQAAISRSALQCYVVEGVYPPNLAYLEEHYGLQINTEDYYVTYDAFASNLPPTVRVVHKAGQ